MRPRARFPYSLHSFPWYVVLCVVMGSNAKMMNIFIYLFFKKGATATARCTSPTYDHYCSAYVAQFAGVRPTTCTV